MKARTSAVAGFFYPNNPETLKNEVISYFENTQKKENNVIGVISPHAGYVYSGKTAAWAIKQLDNSKSYENVFVIGLSHHKYLKGAAVPDVDTFILPGFSIDVNTDLCKNLVTSCEYIEFDNWAHSKEHSIEVQLPFLYYHLKNKFSLVPILVGTNNIAAIKKIGEALSNYLSPENVFVVSTDFSHYPPYEEALEVDYDTANAFISNDLDRFLNQLEQNDTKNYHNLATSACNWAGLALMLSITSGQENYSYKIINYSNSGDSPYGEKDRVVGYFAIALTSK